MITLPTQYQKVPDFTLGRQIRSSDWKQMVRNNNYLFLYSGHQVDSCVFDPVFETESTTFTQTNDSTGDNPYDLGSWQPLWMPTRALEIDGDEAYSLWIVAYGQNLELGLEPTNIDVDQSDFQRTIEIGETGGPQWVAQELLVANVTAGISFELEARVLSAGTGSLFQVSLFEGTQGIPASYLASGGSIPTVLSSSFQGEGSVSLALASQKALDASLVSEGSLSLGELELEEGQQSYYDGVVSPIGDVVAHYSLNETSGTTATDDEGTEDGTYDASITLDVPTSILGSERAIRFPDQAGPLDLGPASNFSNLYSGGSWSITCWYRSTDLQTSTSFYSYGLASLFDTWVTQNGGFRFDLYQAPWTSQDILDFRFDDGTDQVNDDFDISSSSLYDDQWHHLAFIYDAFNDTFDFLIDRGDDFSASADVSVIEGNFPSPDSLLVMSALDAPSLVDGIDMDQITVWDKALDGVSLDSLYYDGIE